MSLTRRQIALVFAGWTVFGWIYGTMLYFGFLAEGAVPQWPFPIFVARQGIRWMLWGLFTPPVVWMARRVPIAWRPRPLAIHLTAAATVAIARGAASAYADRVTNQKHVQPFLGSWLGLLSSYFAVDLLIYFAIAGAVLAIDTRRRLRERELLLAQAQLANLRLQIQPHFLFNTLHTIASLVRQGSGEPAVAMIAGLSDLLRYSLDNAGRNVVSLGEELEVVGRYLEIQQTRFSDRLRVAVDAAPDTLDAAVPTLLLQPLVENAIRHGDATTIDVHARRDGGTLIVEIANDGTPLAADWREREGVGLSTTRRRLEQLYGTAASLALENQEPSGVVARVRFPFSAELA